MDTYDEALRDQALEEEELFWEQLPDNLHEEKVKGYLGIYGDAIDERVSALTKMAKDLFDARFLGPALAVATTALEVMIHFFCVKPMVEGAFLSDHWARILVDLIVRKRPGEHKTLLKGILKLEGIDLQAVKLSNGKTLWESYSAISDARNDFIHVGAEPSKEDVALLIECSTTFRKVIIGQLSEKFGFTLAETGKWAHVINVGSDAGHLGVRDRYEHTKPPSEKRFTPASPFAK